MKRYLGCVTLVLTGLLVSESSIAQTYPAKPVRLVVPFPAGGATDILARTIGQKASEKLGQSIVIDNRPGAGGTIGSDHVAKSPPDGYTLLIATGSTHSIGPIINPKIPYNVERDFVPVVYVANTSSVLVVPGTLPVKNLAEFIALAKSKPGQLNFGSSGNGTNSHLSGELFKAQAKVFLTHIPYRGTGLVFNDMMSGQVHMLMDNYVTAQSNIKEGKLRVLGVTSPQRLPFLPDVPTLDEQGLKGFDVSNWFGIYAPRGTPTEIVLKVNAAFNQALQEPDMQKRLATLGATPTGSTPEQMGAMVAADTAKWTKLIRERKLVVD
ncbi:MAG: MFS transporter [Polaromonas sp. 39-63-203]|uniref:Bug family tripartite tricarboxylate transporter substrate binding protein n=1 Tax=Polaromonas sp. TaxID=1869339 RepID=UPI000BC64C39|nr:tripartite tricarboxylate transporter substrate binding protein [Polaromonas sp.]OZB00119.1 MAG: MFS transporter [Polaromonas sp. 39-63-203]HQS31160.1 tripartite tricarboxylate transporter substrate binding protein [Polaromonas sp.]HQS90296.1 tripartite tricarboxylate transporter substrate binding protein [Polaromonas sp.]